MPQPDHISALGVPDPAGLDDDLQAIWAKCVEKLGFVPNVFSTYSLKPQRLRNFMQMYNEIMLAPSGLSKLEREMVAGGWLNSAISSKRIFDTPVEKIWDAVIRDLGIDPAFLVQGGGKQ